MRRRGLAEYVDVMTSEEIDYEVVFIQNQYHILKQCTKITKKMIKVCGQPDFIKIILTKI